MPQRSKCASRGSVLLSALLYSVLALVIGSVLVSLVVRKFKDQTNFQFAEKKGALLKAIASRAVNDLKENLNSSPDCSLDNLMLATSKSFVASKPQYGKGDFVLEEIGPNQTPTGNFYAPETDPYVYIERKAADGIYKIVIKTSICTVAVSGRVPFPANADNSPRGLGVPWNVPCPTAKTQAVSYEAFFDSSNFISYYSVYLDRSLLGNIAFEEPTLDSADDAEEKDAGGQSTATQMSDGTLKRYTGGTHDGASSCPSRTQSALLSALDSIKATDSCSYISINFAAGRNNGDNVTQYKPMRRLKDYSDAIRDDLLSVCDTRRPAGFTSAQKILEHYLRYEQPDPGSLNEQERNRKHVLLIISEGWNLLGNLAPPSGDATLLRRANIYFTGNGCSGDAMVETYVADASPIDYSGQLIYAGDDVYVPSTSSLPASAPLPTADPPLDPMPDGAYLVRSVLNNLDGSCVDILDSSTNQQEAVQFNYYLRQPQLVEPRRGGVTKVSTVLNAYRPIEDIMALFNNRANNPTTGLKRYPNAITLFPLAATDLDERDIETLNMSNLPYSSSDMALDLVPSYLGFFRWIEVPKTAGIGFSEGVNVFGLTQ